MNVCMESAVTDVSAVGAQPLSLNDWVCIQTIDTEHSRTVRQIAWSPSGRHIAAASFDNTISIWELLDGCFECVATLEGQENEVKSVSWSPAGDLIASCSRDKSVWVWQNDGDGDQEWECLSVLTGHSHDVKQVRFHPHSDSVFSCSYDNTVRVWAAQDDDWYCAQQLQDAASTVWAMAFDHSGNRFATVGDDLALRLYAHHPDAPPARAWQLDAALPRAHLRTIYSVAWSKPVPPRRGASADPGFDGYVATCGGDDLVRVFAVDTAGPKAELREVAAVDGHGVDVNCVAWNPKVTNLLASAGDDNQVVIWRLEEEQE
jgi:WD40 repeat protein